MLWKAYARWKASGIKPTRKEFTDIEAAWDRDLDNLDMIVMRAEPIKTQGNEPPLHNHW